MVDVWIAAVVTAGACSAAYALGQLRGRAVTRQMLESLRETAPAGWLLAMARRWSVDEHRAVVEALRQDLDWRETSSEPAS